MKYVFILFLMPTFLFAQTEPVVNTNETDSGKVQVQIYQQVDSSPVLVNEKPSEEEAEIFYFIKDDILRLTISELKKDLLLSQKKYKKIDKDYSKYISKQLKLKEKLTPYTYKMERQISSKHFDEYKIEDIIKDVYKIKAKIEINNVIICKKIERRLTREQVEKFRELLRFFYSKPL